MPNFRYDLAWDHGLLYSIVSQHPLVAVPLNCLLPLPYPIYWSKKLQFAGFFPSHFFEFAPSSGGRGAFFSLLTPCSGCSGWVNGIQRQLMQDHLWFHLSGGLGSLSHNPYFKFTILICNNNISFSSLTLNNRCPSGLCTQSISVLPIYSQLRPSEQH